jgi:hypothetical protein
MPKDKFDFVTMPFLYQGDTHIFLVVSRRIESELTQENQRKKEILARVSTHLVFSLYGKTNSAQGPGHDFLSRNTFFIILLLLRIISLLYEEAKNTVLACLLLFLLVSTNGMITGHCHNPSTV